MALARQTKPSTELLDQRKPIHRAGRLDILKPSWSTALDPPYRDPRPRRWHNATISLDWPWYDIWRATWKCTECGRRRLGRPATELA